MRDDRLAAGADELPERLSRWAAWITLGFLVVLWPGIAVLAHAWDCAGDCKDAHGRTIVVLGVGALILAPVAALVFMLARKLRRSTGPTPRGAVTASAFALTTIAALTLLIAMTLWAGAAGALVAGSRPLAFAGNSFVLALVMSVYCAAVAGGTWMSTVGVSKLEGGA